MPVGLTFLPRGQGDPPHPGHPYGQGTQQLALSALPCHANPCQAPVAAREPSSLIPRFGALPSPLQPPWTALSGCLLPANLRQSSLGRCKAG